MTLPEPLTVTFSGLIGDIEKGLIKFPNSKEILYGI